MNIMNSIDLKQKLDLKEVVLIDVRQPEEYKSEHIEGAVLIPLGDISMEKLPETNQPLVVYCRSGKRSMDACARLLKECPFLDIASLDGGIMDWIQAGYSVKR
jgi:rhodanese-related sulfurtransferase